VVGCASSGATASWHRAATCSDMRSSDMWSPLKQPERHHSDPTAGCGTTYCRPHAGYGLPVVRVGLQTVTVPPQSSSSANWRSRSNPGSSRLSVTPQPTRDKDSSADRPVVRNTQIGTLPAVMSGSGDQLPSRQASKQPHGQVLIEAGTQYDWQRDMDKAGRRQGSCAQQVFRGSGQVRTSQHLVHVQLLGIAAPVVHAEAG